MENKIIQVDFLSKFEVEENLKKLESLYGTNFDKNSIKIEKFKILNEFASTKEIEEKFGYGNESYDQALKKGYRAHGYFWMKKSDWESGKRPNVNRQIRNRPIYVYYPEAEKIDIKKQIVKDKDIGLLIFIGKFKTPDDAAKFLDISIAKIYQILKGQAEVHRGYYFSYEPLRKEEENVVIKKVNETKYKAFYEDDEE